MSQPQLCGWLRFATADCVTEIAMSHLFREARDNAQDILAAVAAAAYFLGFLGAVHIALARLLY
jgi:predicted trehalose synthase